MQVTYTIHLKEDKMKIIKYKIQSNFGIINFINIYLFTKITQTTNLIIYFDCRHGLQEKSIC